MTETYKENWKAFVKRMQGELDNMRYDLELAKGCITYGEAQFYLKRAEERGRKIDEYYEKCKELGLEAEKV